MIVHTTYLYSSTSTHSSTTLAVATFRKGTSGDKDEYTTSESLFGARSSAVKKVKVCFYIAQYPLHGTAQSALHLSSPGRPVHSDTNSASLGSILAMQQLRNDYSLTCPPLSIARYSFI